MDGVTSRSAPPVVAVAGSGSIGVAFAIVFARAGFTVRVWDPVEESLVRAAGDLRDRLRMLREADLLDEPVDVVERRVELLDDLETAVRGAALVQECAPEDIDLKRALFDRIGVANAEAVIASSSSAHAPSTFARGLPCEDRVLGGHPGNPPYLIPVIEVIPSPATSDAVLATAETLYSQAGLTTVRVNHEPEGFVFNRLQGALLREAYCLVRDGVATVEDVDEVVRSGLGRRWCFIGPFETADLNTRGGIVAHADRMGAAYARMGAERGQDDPWSDELVADVDAQRRTVLPLDEWEGRVRWRDAQLMRWCREFG